MATSTFVVEDITHRSENGCSSHGTTQSLGGVARLLVVDRRNSSSRMAVILCGLLSTYPMLTHTFQFTSRVFQSSSPSS